MSIWAEVRDRRERIRAAVQSAPRGGVAVSVLARRLRLRRHNVYADLCVLERERKVARVAHTSGIVTWHAPTPAESAHVPEAAPAPKLEPIEPAPAPAPQPDNINPSHYSSGSVECIDAMRSAYGYDAVEVFCRLNAFKYLWRAEKKNGVEDLRKAAWYLEMAAHLRGQGPDPRDRRKP